MVIAKKKLLLFSEVEKHCLQKTLSTNSFLKANNCMTKAVALSSTKKSLVFKTEPVINSIKNFPFFFFSTVKSERERESNAGAENYTKLVSACACQIP